MRFTLQKMTWVATVFPRQRLNDVLAVKQQGRIKSCSLFPLVLSQKLSLGVFEVEVSVVECSAFWI
jgi:hypothetical protein